MDKNKAVDAMTEAAADAKQAGYALNLAVADAYMAGASWAEIGKTLGISKQTAYNRYSETVEAEKSMREWQAKNPAKAAEAVKQGRENAESIITEIQKRIWKQDAAKQDAAAETPAKKAAKKIDAKAPATGGTSRQKAVAAEVENLRNEIREKAAQRRKEATGNDGPYRTRHAIPDPDTTAQPGIGKGHPHACPNCGDTNHKTEWRDVAQFDADCVPTQYDPPKIAMLIKFQNHL